MRQSGFFDVEERLARLSGPADQLEAFSRIVDFEVFRPNSEKAMAYSDGGKSGRPPFGPSLMFKILVIHTLNNLPDERTEYLINDHFSFMEGSKNPWFWPSLCDSILGVMTGGMAHEAAGFL